MIRWREGRVRVQGPGQQTGGTAVPEGLGATTSSTAGTPGKYKFCVLLLLADSNITSYLYCSVIITYKVQCFVRCELIFSFAVHNSQSYAGAEGVAKRLQAAVPHVGEQSRRSGNHSQENRVVVYAMLQILLLNYCVHTIHAICVAP